PLGTIKWYKIIADFTLIISTLFAEYATLGVTALCGNLLLRFRSEKILNAPLSAYRIPAS
ncbi:MAG: hypothetical protein QNL96_16565, partial [SAR86 cluster bacterium]